jgi:hypothetical protein
MNFQIKSELSQRKRRMGWWLAMLLVLSVGLPLVSLRLSPVLAANLSATNSPQLPGGIVYFSGDGFAPGEALDAIVTGPDGKSTAIKYGGADDQGQVAYSFNTAGCAIGRWYLTLRGQSSQIQATAFFDVVNNLSDPTPTPGGSIPNPGTTPGAGSPTPGPTEAPVPKGDLQVTPETTYAGQTVNITGGGFKPNEQVGLWETDPNKIANSLGFISSDADGNINYNYKSHGPAEGIWAVTAHGNTSGTEKSGFFRVRVTSDALPSIRLDPDHGNKDTLINVFGTNFFPSEIYTYWATAPDGQVYAGVQFPTLSDGSFYFLYNLPSNPLPGRWAITVQGLYSNRQAVANFTLEG